MNYPAIDYTSIRFTFRKPTKCISNSTCKKKNYHHWQNSFSYNRNYMYTTKNYSLYNISTIS